jgi:MEMO1 family protein
MHQTNATRTPAASGRLYPSLPARLRADVRRLIGDEPGMRRAVAALVPHAGYAYSGATLGATFRAVHVPATCVILGPNHSGRAIAADGGSALLDTPYRTPLGDALVDAALGERILAAAGSLMVEDHVAHSEEQSIEVVLPFLQVRNPDVRVVPLLVGWDDWARTRRLAEVLHQAIGDRRDVLVLVSSDMNHYEPIDITTDKDSLVLEKLIALDGEGLLGVTHDERITMCGRAAAACACELARIRGASKGEVISYSHSGLVSNDRESVIGFAGVLLGTDAP